ncbi:vacuolar protein sorting-associated protein 32 homolog 2-like [Carica papaya]|uniref:vacuolar protein sorting-associated protein 32 homolog 2-like n=1 Tax=Carica papaya TaxID=3649 RepID=UPI000B8C7CF0|nr:vacuolar protein sorting-associated protein 32 homolog 2-like [Carica papaya]
MLLIVLIRYFVFSLILAYYDFAAAIQCLKRKRLYEQQIEQLGNFQLRIHDQMIMLEGAKATTETVDALRTGAAAMKAMQKATNIDDVDKTMDEINEQTENMKQIQEALSTPIGAAADFDEVLILVFWYTYNSGTWLAD